MIRFEDWRLVWDGAPVAMQFDNGSTALEIRGTLPEGYGWELLLQEPEGGLDILPMEQAEDGVRVVLKRENLPRGGTYGVQLRGTGQEDPAVRRHSSVVGVVIPQSLSGDTAWPEIPTKFSELEERLRQMLAHPPKPGADGYWMLWDEENGYQPSQLPVGSAGPKGDRGETGPQGPTGPQGLSGATVSADGSYGFDVDEDGHLRLHYTGDTAPDFALDEDGHLILTLEGGQTVDLGKAVGSDYVLTEEDKAEIAGKVPVATAEQAGTVKAGTDFDVAQDGTLSLYKALTLIANVTPATVEQGATQTTATVKWATNKTPVSVTVEGESVSPDATSKELTGLSITAEKTFTVVAADSRGSQTFTAVMRFCNGVYTGAAAAPAAVDSAFIRTLTKTLQSGRSRTFTVNAAAGQYIWYACPAGYGTPVFNVGGFDGGFSKVATLDYTNPSGYTESYQVWRSDNAGLGQTTVKVS